jgi:hypothetical protein
MLAKNRRGELSESIQSPILYSATMTPIYNTRTKYIFSVSQYFFARIATAEILADSGQSKVGAARAGKKVERSGGGFRMIHFFIPDF